MPNSVFSFYRTENFTLDALVVVDVLHKTEVDASQVVAAITLGVTNWINDCERGKHAWVGSHRDLNMGDLVDHLRDPDLRTKLKAEGIIAIRHVTSLSVTNGVRLDTVLVDRDKLSESIES